MTPTGRRPRVEMLPDVEAERLELADFLQDLDDREWAAESLCPGWTVQDVVAHLTLSTRQPLVSTLVRVARARGDFDRVVAEMASERARRFDRAELVAQLRETAGSSRRFPLAGRLDPLVDVLVHGQDIARPLGRDRPMRPDRVVPALEYVWSSAFYGCPERFEGVRFVADDGDWSGGEGGREVRGAAGDLLLVATGRPAGTAGLRGAVEEVTARMHRAR